MKCQFDDCIYYMPCFTVQVMRFEAVDTSALLATLSTMAHRTIAMSRPSSNSAVPVPVLAEGTSSVSCSRYPLGSAEGAFVITSHRNCARQHKSHSRMRP